MQLYQCHSVHNLQMDKYTITVDFIELFRRW